MRSASTSTTSPTDSSWSSFDAGGYRDSAVVEARGLGMDPVGRRVRIRAFWERDGDRWLWRGMFERVPLPETWPVYVTWAEAERIRAMARTPAADRGRVSPRGVRHARGSASAAIPWGDAMGSPVAWQLRLQRDGIRNRLARTLKGRAPSACTI